jgi:hypothetical protein
LTVWPKQRLVSNTNYEAPHYAVSPTPVTSSLLNKNIFLNTPVSNTHSQVITSMWETKFHTHIKQEYYISVYFKLCILRQQTGRQKILEQMATGIPWVLSALNFLMCVILMY